MHMDKYLIELDDAPVPVDLEARGLAAILV